MFRSSNPESCSPAPRISTLIYRSSPRVEEPGSDWRPRPSVAERAIARHFDALNGVEEGECWVTRASEADRVHVVPHAESACARLILWLQLMELTPMEIRERSKWKASSANLVPLQHKIHWHLHDGDRRRAILRPTRKDLLQLAQVLEDALRRECQSTQPDWRPQWNDIVQNLWPRQQTIGAIRRPEYRYQIDFFALRPRAIFNMMNPDAEHSLAVAPGTNTYPQTLKQGLDQFKAPLSILSVIAVAVSQMWFIRRTPDRRYKPEFLEDLDVMSYIINVLESPVPSYFASLKRPSILPPLPRVDPPSSNASTPVRQWPNTSLQPTSAPRAVLPEFSSSPVHGDKEDLYLALIEMESDQTSEHDGPFAGDTQEDEDDSGGSRGGGSWDQRSRSRRAHDAGQSDGQHSSTATSDLWSESLDTSGDSQLEQANLDAAMSSMQLESRAADAAGISDSSERKDGQQNENCLAEPDDMQNIDPPLGTTWHQEWQLLDDEQDLVFQTAVSALAEGLRASSRTGITGDAETMSTLFEFLVSDEPLLGIAPRLQVIEQRRERMWEQWEEVLHRRETRQWLEREEARMA